MPTYNLPDENNTLYCCHHHDKKGARIPAFDKEGEPTFYRMSRKDPEKGFQFMCKKCNSVHMTEYRIKSLEKAERKAIRQAAKLTAERKAQSDLFFEASACALEKVNMSAMQKVDKEILNGHIRRMSALYMQSF